MSERTYDEVEDNATDTARIGYLQFQPSFMDVNSSFERICELIKGHHADLLVLPELATTGYAFPDKPTLFQLAETIPGPTTDRFVELARSLGGAIVVGLAEKDGSKIYNSAAIIGAHGVLGCARKSHLFWNEKELFAPGDSGFFTVDLGPLKVGAMICFDWAFPEAAGTLARRGAEVIAHPSNLVLEHAQRVMPVRCLENRVFAVTANRWGEEQTEQGTLAFRGESIIVSPAGEVLARAPQNGDEVRILTVSPGQAADKRLTPRNHVFLDRRPELYDKH